MSGQPKAHFVERGWTACNRQVGEVRCTTRDPFFVECAACRSALDDSPPREIDGGRACTTCGVAWSTVDRTGYCGACRTPEPPEPVEPVFSECRFCGASFEGSNERNDCGGCRLTDEQCREYAADLAEKYHGRTAGAR